MASLPVIAGQELDEGLEEMWLGSAQGIQVIDAGESMKHFCSTSFTHSSVEMEIEGNQSKILFLILEAFK